MPNALIETTEDERIFAVQDLVALVEHLEEYADETLFKTFNKMLKCETPEERMDIATSILEEDRTGLAHLVLAIGNSDTDKQKQHLKQALELTKKLNDEYVFGFGTLRLGKLLWKLEEREEAIRVLENADVNNLLVGQHVVDEIRFSLVAYLIVQNNDERAREILDGEAVSSFEWYYLNALLRFRQLGDNFIARGALYRALGENEIIAFVLSDTEYDGDQNDLEELDRWTRKYIDLTRECWNETPNAMSWLTETLTRDEPGVGFSEDLDQVLASSIDDEFEVAMAHMASEDFESAKRSFIKALRDANKLNDGGAMFLFIIEMATAILDEVDQSQEPFIELLNERVTWLDGQAAIADPKALMNSYLNLAKAFHDDVEDMRGAEICAQKAYDIFDNIRSDTDSQTGDNILTILGSVAAQKDDYKSLESHMRAAISMCEQTHGSAHLSIIDQLQLLRYALHRQDKHDEEAEIAKRVYAIDVHADQDEDFEDLNWCEIN
jgi:tetratricopeptide (TPR) repeat protein